MRILRSRLQNISYGNKPALPSRDIIGRPHGLGVGTQMAIDRWRLAAFTAPAFPVAAAGLPLTREPADVRE